MKKLNFIPDFFCFLMFSVLSMALQEYGSFNPANKGFYLCILQGAVFGVIMHFAFRFMKVKKKNS